jgi:hypothetical protein
MVMVVVFVRRCPLVPDVNHQLAENKVNKENKHTKG